MSTVESTTASVHPDRVFFPLIALTIIIYVIVGFAPTYYLRAGADLPELPMAVHLHGLLYSAWVALFLLQAVLIRSRSVQGHKRIGYSALGLAAAMVIVGVVVTIRSSAVFPDPNWLFAIAFGDLLMFAVFISAAVYFRRVGAVHKRLMLLGTVAIIDAGTARWPVIAALFVDDPASLVGTISMYAAQDSIIALAIVYDIFAHGRVHAAYIWGGIALVLSQALRIAIIDTGPWQSLTQALLAMAQ